jgi:hypothetical protein
VGQPVRDPKELLERLRTEHRVLQWVPLEPAAASGTGGEEQVRDRTSLEYLHRHWALPEEFDAAGAGGGVRGKVTAMFGRMTYRVLGRYLGDERELLANMVRVAEALEQRCDQLTRRIHELEQSFVDRQVAEASNLAELAVWLNADRSTTAPVPSGEALVDEVKRSAP